MPNNKITIGFKIEDITKLSCLNVSCKFNLYKDCGYYHCNLKYVELNEVGVCFYSLGGGDGKDNSTDKG